MTTTTLHPEVTAFLAQVRARLGDLSEDQRDELLEGLEADLSEQLEAGDPLPEPSAYAAELRAAAGIAASRGRPRSVGSTLDRARDSWLRLTRHDEATRQAWSLAVALRPAWWVLRAWIAVTLLDQAVGPWEYVTLWPSLAVPLVGPLLLGIAVVVSALIGLGRLWPGSGPERGPVARLVLLALNLVALAAPFSFTGDGSQQWFNAPSAQAVAVQPHQERVLRQGSRVIRNIQAYGADGQPLLGVQLFDQAGRPVAVSPWSSTGRGAKRTVTCPWLNGTAELFNVFPLPEVTKRRGTCRSEQDRAAATQPPPPLALVPSVPQSTTTSDTAPTETP